MKTVRNYNLSNKHLAILDGDQGGGPTTNRSKALSKMLANTISNPHRLLDVLCYRLNTDIEVPGETTRISVTLPEAVIQGLDELTLKMSIATEHVIRLSLEAEASKALSRWEPQPRRNQNEPTGHLQPPPEGGDHSQ